MNCARLCSKHFARRVDHSCGGRIERTDLLQYQALIGQRLRNRHSGAQRRNRGRRSSVHAFHQFDVVLFDKVERQIPLNRHRHLGQKVGGALPGIE